MAFALPALGFALGPLFEDTTPTLAGRRRGGRLQRPDLRAARHEHRRRRSATPARPPSTSASSTATATRSIEGQDPQPYVAISTRCAHLGCPVRYIQASQKFVCPCHGGVYDSRARSRAARRCARSTASTPASENGRVRGGRPLLAQLRARALLAARPVEPPRRAVAVPLPVEAHHMKLPSPPLPKALRRSPPRPGQTTSRKNGGRNGGAGHQADRRRTRRSRASRASSAGSTSARAPARSCAASSTARSRRAPTGSTRSARPRCSPSSRRP